MSLALVGAGLAAGGALVGVAAELAARAWLRARGDYYVLRPWNRVAMHVDRGTLPQLEEVVRIEINRDGERGPDPPRDWRDTFRVLVAGGSAAECYLLDQDSTWPAVMREGLDRDARALGTSAVHVGNVSRSLVACDYIDLMLRRSLPRYPRLDVLVLMVGASDVVAWLEKKTPPVLEKGELATRYVFDEHPEGPYTWTASGLALRQLVSRWQRRLLRPLGRREGAGGRIGKNREMRARAKQMVDQVPDPGPMLAGFEQGLRMLIETARGHARRVLVVRQPWLRREFSAEEDALLWNFGAGRPYVEEVTTYYSHGVVNELMSAVDGVASRVAQELGVEQLDLMGEIEHDFESFYDRLHFTPKGARAVGEAVARAILEPGPGRGPTGPE
jgi:hypothetical protein